MKRIDRMPHDLDIINHTALYNHNECVDKINEIIDVLNAWETPKEKYIEIKKDKKIGINRIIEDALNGKLAYNENGEIDRYVAKTRYDILQSRNRLELATEYIGSMIEHHIAVAVLHIVANRGVRISNRDTRILRDVTKEALKECGIGDFTIDTCMCECCITVSIKALLPFNIPEQVALDIQVYCKEHGGEGGTL